MAEGESREESGGRVRRVSFTVRMPYMNHAALVEWAELFTHGDRSQALNRLLDEAVPRMREEVGARRQAEARSRVGLLMAYLRTTYGEATAQAVHDVVIGDPDPASLERRLSAGKPQAYRDVSGRPGFSMSVSDFRRWCVELARCYADPFTSE